MSPPKQKPNEVNLMEIRKPSELVEESGLKILIHGPAGAGKTVLATTSKEPTLIISAEGGLLSIKDAPEYIDAVVVDSMDGLREVYEHLKTQTPYKWVIIDSLSEVGEVLLADEKQKTRDPRQAYGVLIDEMQRIVRAFRDLPYNVVLTCKQERAKDEATGITYYVPSMPGAKLSQQLPYFFDIVGALRVEKDDEGQPYRVLQTCRDLQYDAKDRSGKLDNFEKPDLAYIKEKIHGNAK